MLIPNSRFVALALPILSLPTLAAQYATRNKAFNRTQRMALLAAMEFLVQQVYGDMLVHLISFVSSGRSSSGPGSRFSRSMLVSSLLLGTLLGAFPVFGRDQTPGWQTQVRKYSEDRKSTRLNSSLSSISYAVFCLKKKKTTA